MVVMLAVQHLSRRGMYRSTISLSYANIVSLAICRPNQEKYVEGERDSIVFEDVHAAQL